MYKVFFNDRVVLLTDDFHRHFQSGYGLFYKYLNQSDLRDIIGFFSSLKKIDKLFIFHYDLDELRLNFRSCFLNIDASGGLVRNRDGKVLIIKRRGKWDLPKGKLDDAEDSEAAAIREVSEECGINELEITEKLLATYHSYYIGQSLVLKRTNWYSMIYKGDSEPIPETGEEITEVKWFDPSQINQICDNTYPSVTDVLLYAGLLKL
jgi:8-oxo-dGTP pyrophosphatase MutT (NUDIX family)